MNEFLVDTSALIAFFVPSETHHAVAKNFFGSILALAGLFYRQFLTKPLLGCGFAVLFKLLLLSGKPFVAIIITYLFLPQRTKLLGRRSVNMMINFGAIQIVLC